MVILKADFKREVQLRRRAVRSLNFFSSSGGFLNILTIIMS